MLPKYFTDDERAEYAKHESIHFRSSVTEANRSIANKEFARARREEDLKLMSMNFSYLPPWAQKDILKQLLSPQKKSVHYFWGIDFPAYWDKVKRDEE